MEQKLYYVRKTLSVSSYPILKKIHSEKFHIVYVRLKLELNIQNWFPV